MFQQHDPPLPHPSSAPSCRTSRRCCRLGAIRNVASSSSRRPSRNYRCFRPQLSRTSTGRHPSSTCGQRRSRPAGTSSKHAIPQVFLGLSANHRRRRRSPQQLLQFPSPGH
ncbi:hypothetical protein NDU88_004628 [Pleurodeles waltl]|uniref:Uncharacterized protein n=1 Tax=Pleurodeles waltl TaxID=8319 RepID=A0AAV7RL07_PLEWA|nr:hypothetical protein NDU88_004628 [Pleurodeles waltl]